MAGAKPIRIAASPRIEALRQEVVAARPILCSERALLVTESYKESESMPHEMRRALALKHILDNMTQNIFPGELLVGSHGATGRRSAPVFPEFATEWLADELDSKLETREQDVFIVPAQVKQDIHSVLDYWKGKTIYDRYRALVPAEARAARDAYMFSRDLFERNGYGHTCYDIPKLLRLGYQGIRDEIRALYAGLDYATAAGIEKKVYYEASMLCIDAVIDFAHRYSATALSYASIEPDPVRRAELEKIADVCRHVPEHPARDIWDAAQVVVFMQLLIQTETNGDSVSPGRLDQHFYPYYSHDISTGKFTNEQVQEILDCLWLKLNEVIKVQDSESIHIHPGFPMTPNITIGGVTPTGDDAVNELSYLMLNSQEHIRLTSPQFTVRISEHTPDEFKARVAEVISLGTGMPALFGDPGCMSAIRKTFADMPEDRVRDFGIVGCVELAPRGFQARVNGGFLNVARVVDLALNDGIDRLTGGQIGPRSGAADELMSFGEVCAAIREQMAYFVKMQVINACAVDMVQRVHTPHLLLSTLIEGCLEKGRDMTWGTSLWGATPILHVGLATAANSLAAVKRLVFEERKHTLADLKRAQDANFAAGYQTVQHDLLSAPKYGNDDDYADDVMVSLTNMFFDEIEKHTDIDGRPYTSMILTLGGTVPHGWKTGATADGRLATMPVSDSMSPANGTDFAGPTAVLVSAGKIDQSRVLEGNVLNLKFSKTALSSDDDLKKLMSMVDAYLLDLKGQEVQINVVDGALLLDAQQHPDKYQDLIIRVAGYSARFVELARELQDDIILRTQHNAV